MFTLIYIHANFTSLPNKCLDSVQKTWPRDGILRVRISLNSSVRLNNGHTVFSHYTDNDIYLNESVDKENESVDKETEAVHFKNVSTFVNNSNLDLFHSVPDEKPSIPFKHLRETLLHSHESISEGRMY